MKGLLRIVPLVLWLLAFTWFRGVRNAPEVKRRKAARRAEMRARRAATR